jgi:N-methylhydantoinase A/oxoprolinase/acetone carboxylase beta subunit
MKSHRIAVDVGGTFTDVFVLDERTGEIDIRKVPSTPDDPSEGIISGLLKTGVALDRVRLFSHGTTVGTNALITRNFPRAALITTEGFRDVLGRGSSGADALRAFHRAHEREYAYAQPNEPVEIFSIRVTGTGRLPKPELPVLAPGTGGPPLGGKRRVYFEEVGGFIEVPTYHRSDLKAGMHFAGPAIVEQFDSTVVVPPNSDVTVEQHGNLVMNVGAN